MSLLKFLVDIFIHIIVSIVITFINGISLLQPKSIYSETDQIPLPESATGRPSPANLKLSLKSTTEPVASDFNNKEQRNQTPLPKEPKSPTSVKDMKDLILANSKNIFGKVISPSKDKSLSSNNNSSGNYNSVTAKKQPNSTVDSKKSANNALMSRRELTDPFGSDEEEEESKNVTATEAAGDNRRKTELSDEVSPCDYDVDANESMPLPHQHLLNRHSEQCKRAKQLLVQSRRDSSNSITQNCKSEEERQAMLKERARKLIAEVRMNGVGGKTEIIRSSPESDDKPKKTTEHVSLERQNSTESEKNGNFTSQSPLQENTEISSPVIKERITPDKIPEDIGFIKMIEQELEDLEREQSAIDKQAASLEKKLRTVMEAANSSGEEEEALMGQWFTLVNKKNALLRRQMQLNILEKESDLERRYKMLNHELSLSLSIDDWRKTDEQRAREALLLEELVQIVNKRDELVHHLDTQEKAIEEDDLIEADLSQVDFHNKQTCVLQ